MKLVREIIYPTENNYTIYLPDEMIGKQIEVIAFEIEKTPSETIKNKLIDIQNIFKDSLVDLSNFKFDRDEANDTV